MKHVKYIKECINQIHRLIYYCYMQFSFQMSFQYNILSHASQIWPVTAMWLWYNRLLHTLLAPVRTRPGVCPHRFYHYAVPARTVYTRFWVSQHDLRWPTLTHFYSPKRVYTYLNRIQRKRLCHWEEKGNHPQNHTPSATICSLCLQMNRMTHRGQREATHRMG